MKADLYNRTDDTLNTDVDIDVHYSTVDPFNYSVQGRV